MSDDCGCCQTPPAAVPAVSQNRPGLSSVAYRIGTFASFRQAIVGQLAANRELAALTARVGTDHAITVIELWSAVADVLTFYEERTANEAFLNTATQRDSVLRMVRLIGYQLQPGAAATADLAFTLDGGAAAVIPAGTRVQSIPGEGEQPQKFETTAAVSADARLNRLRLFPPPAGASPTSAGTSAAIVAPDPPALAAAAQLAPGDHVLLYAPGAVEILTLGHVGAADDMLEISWRVPITDSSFAAAEDGADPANRGYKLGRSFHLFGIDAPPTVIVVRRTVAADPKTTFLDTAATDFSLHGDKTVGDQVALDGQYSGLKAGSTVLVVATVGGATTAIPFTVALVAQRLVQRDATPISPPPGGTVVAAASGTVTVLTLTALTSVHLAALAAVPGLDARNIVVHELLGDPLRFWPYRYPGTVASRRLYLPGRRAGWSSVEVGRSIVKGAYKPGVAVDVSAFDGGRAVLLTDARGAPATRATVESVSIVGTNVELAATNTDKATIASLGLSPEQAMAVTVVLSGALPATVAFPNPRRELGIQIGGFPRQTVTLDPAIVGTGARAQVAAALQQAIRAALPGAATFAHALAWVIDDAISIAAGVPGDRITLGPTADDTDTLVALHLADGQVRYLDGVVSSRLTGPVTVSGSVRVTLGVDPAADRAIAAAAPNAAALATAVATAFGVRAQATTDDRVVVLPPPPSSEPKVFLRLAVAPGAAGSSWALDTPTAALLGNIAPASHGETVRAEIVGDGDASQPFQRFPLRKKPVTFVPAPTPGGVASSLSLLVNGVRWSEQPSLYGAAPTDEVYVSRVADDGTLTVQFGDGTTGARPPTGRQNIVAWYRQGIGVAGRVKAGTLTTLLDRPTGVKNVLNLAASDGGADPETMARARQAAPGTVRTFGRAVSRQDFEDTALLAGEVAKVAATWVWTGERRAIHLTVAAQGGATFSADGLARLAATLASERDPNHRVLIDNSSAVAITVTATLAVGPRYRTADVVAAARVALLGELSFESRRFAQPVYLSDLFGVLQDIPGVAGVDVEVLDLKSTNAAFRAAHGIDPGIAQPLPQLLMLPARPAGTAGVVLPAELAWVEAPATDVVLRGRGGLA